MSQGDSENYVSTSDVAVTLSESDRLLHTAAATQTIGDQQKPRHIQDVRQAKINKWRSYIVSTP